MKRLLIKVGAILLILSIALLLWQLRIAIQSEVSYIIDKPEISDIKVELNNEDITKEDNKTVFLSPNFGLSIPKINANANVLPNIDPFNENEYNNALKNGVAHAKGTALPSQNGNVFMFAHSAENFYENSKYNIYFYLLNKLEKDDEIYVSYQNRIFKYLVEEVKIVNKTDIQYLSKHKEYNTLTLMTCWPAGIDYSRLIVIARQISN